VNRQETLRWLADLQHEFGSVMRTPLDARSGQLKAAVERYPQAICAAVSGSAQRTAAERLAIYNRQYWLRLLRALQNEYPLTCRLHGAWRFNQLAMRFLHAHPPRGHDLARVADGFDGWLAQQLRADPTGRRDGPRACFGEAVLEAAQLDAAVRRIVSAPEQPRFRLTQGVSAASRLCFSSAYARFSEHWPLVRLRARISAEVSERPVDLPERLPLAQTWALFRTTRGVGQVLLAPLHARLLALLEAQPLGAALERLEAECPRQEREALPERVQRWLERSARLDIFTGVVVGSAGTRDGRSSPGSHEPRSA
jgi:transposase